MCFHRWQSLGAEASEVRELGVAEHLDALVVKKLKVARELKTGTVDLNGRDFCILIIFRNIDLFKTESVDYLR